MKPMKTDENPLDGSIRVEYQRLDDDDTTAIEVTPGRPVLADMFNRYLSHPDNSIKTSSIDFKLWVKDEKGRLDTLASRFYSQWYNGAAVDDRCYGYLRRVARGLEILENWGKHKCGVPQLDYLRRQLGCDTFELPQRTSLGTNLGIVLAVLPVLWPQAGWPSRADLADLGYDPEDAAAALALAIGAWLQEGTAPCDSIKECLG